MNVTKELLFSIYTAIAEDVTLRSAIAEFYVIYPAIAESKFCNCGSAIAGDILQLQNFAVFFFSRYVYVIK